MIGVLADDFSGAAEIGGVACRHGLKARVLSEPRGGVDADVVVLNTDSRSLPPAQARCRAFEAGLFLKELQPEWIFKKTDSVLRGPVLPELRGLMDSLGAERCLLIPGSPPTGRVVKHGVLLVLGRPLAETYFSQDPDHPPPSSLVTDLLEASGDQPALLLRPGQALGPRGVLVGEASSQEEVRSWAQQSRSERLLAAGAAAVFDEVLQAYGHGSALGKSPGVSIQGTLLWVHGSSSVPSRQILHEQEARGVCVCRMPDSVFHSQSLEGLHAWGALALEELKRRPCVVVAIDRDARFRPGFSQTLAGLMGQVVSLILAQSKVDGLLLEGGATASVVVQILGDSSWGVRHEWEPGVVSLEGGVGPIITVKPGSYPWPQEILRSLIPSRK